RVARRRDQRGQPHRRGVRPRRRPVRAPVRRRLLPGEPRRSAAACRRGAAGGSRRVTTRGVEPAPWLHRSSNARDRDLSDRISANGSECHFDPFTEPQRDRSEARRSTPTASYRSGARAAARRRARRSRAGWLVLSHRFWCNNSASMVERTMTWRALTSSVALGALALGWIAGCGAAGSDGDGGGTVREEPRPSYNGDDTPPGASPGDPNVPSTGVRGPDFNVSDDDVDGITPMGCQQAAREFVPNIPTVYLLVDRSGTMFDLIDNNVSAWTALRGGVLDVMRELEGSVRFGFAAFSGANIGAQTCDLQVPAVPPKLNNYADIAALYEPLEGPSGAQQKGTPTALAIEEIAQQLRADTATIGDKYILFVTDGEPDYCDDGNQLCPPDSVVGLLQRLASGVDATGAPATPIRTLVFGVSSPTAT